MMRIYAEALAGALIAIAFMTWLTGWRPTVAALVLVGTLAVAPTVERTVRRWLP